MSRELEMLRCELTRGEAESATRSFLGLLEDASKKKKRKQAPSLYMKLHELIYLENLNLPLYQFAFSLISTCC